MGLITAPCVWFGATSKERPLGAGFLAMKERYDGNTPQIGRQNPQQFLVKRSACGPKPISTKSINVLTRGVRDALAWQVLLGQMRA